MDSDGRRALQQLFAMLTLVVCVVEVLLGGWLAAAAVACSGTALWFGLRRR
jgi:hypothetical protein